MRAMATGVITAMLIASGCANPGAIGPPAPDRVTGVIIEIDSEAFGEVTSFKLKDGDATLDIYIADDVDYSFPLAHLQEHVQSAEPVTVDLEERRDDRLYALTIEDV